MPETSDRWWRHAVIYQVYPRSFADGTGDGIGDLAGIRTRLPYLAELGVDALWFSPWYPSPMADAGYDIADHRDIDPVFGTLADAEALLGEAHQAGLRCIVDVVPNHCSTAHPWFAEAVQAGPGSAARELFWFRPGRGADGELPPNDWQSIFGGPAWTRTTNPDGTGGEWYLHLFAPEQPDFNWGNPKVREEFESILRFWLDRGVDGIRIDSAALLCKDPALPDFGAGDPDPYTDRDELHEIYRSWRRITDRYRDRALIGEIWLPDTERFARYLRPDELHQAFNFDFLGCHWDAAALRGCIDDTLAAHRPVDAPATWVLSNHDVVRHVTRYGRADTSFALDHRQHRAPSDRALGTRRARSAALLSLALPGAAYVYQGDELGLPEVEELSDEVRQDPMFHRSGGTDVGRDGCRVPLPWAGRRPPYGFSPAGSDATPWLPQPAGWAPLTAQAQRDDPASMLTLYRRALAIRRDSPELRDERFDWLDTRPGVLAFRRGDGFGCVVNLAAHPAPLPSHVAVLLASAPLAGGLLPPDTAAWLRLR
ncbi:alpha-glucosidase [Actinocatenispora thailandica]|uniref:Alpha-glucosidase n=1 Tax=Actinocatenispora thailandica TaxID=227318 RepID=A0A7R7HYA4_9ACTN|nr:glycoside hydrolase family 13 protein [Actinocatenispora thailandica]BCJ35858.1 alpha-glucosidase [Actinocatenispora thailandica]